MIADVLRSILGSLLLCWPLVLVLIAVVWRYELLIGRLRARQDELRSLVGQAIEDASFGRELSTERSFVAWDIDWAGDGTLRVTNTGRDKARSVTVKAVNDAGTFEKTLSTVGPGDTLDAGVVLASAGDTDVDITWRSQLGRWTTDRQTLSR